MPREECPLAEDVSFRVADEVVKRDVAGETFLVPIRGHVADLQELFIVNEVGGWLWDRLDGRRRVDDLVADVVAEFEVSEQQAREDVSLFMAQLADAGLIEIAESGKG